MTIEKLNILPQGNYVLAQPWVCKPNSWFWNSKKSRIDDLARVISVDYQQQTIIFPPQLILTVTYHSNKWVKLSFFRKYNLGTGINKFVYEFRAGQKLDCDMPVLEVP